MHEVDNWFLLLGPLQSWRAIFAENRNVQLSKQVELGGFGFTSLFSYLQDSLPQQTAVPQHSTQSVPLVRRAGLRLFQPAACIRAIAKLKSSLCLLMSAIHQKKSTKQQKTNPKKEKHLKITWRKVLRPQYPRHTWNITKLIDYKHSLLRLGKEQPLWFLSYARKMPLQDKNLYVGN